MRTTENQKIVLTAMLPFVDAPVGLGHIVPDSKVVGREEVRKLMPQLVMKGLVEEVPHQWQDPVYRLTEGGLKIARANEPFETAKA